MGMACSRSPLPDDAAGGHGNLASRGQGPRSTILLRRSRRVNAARNDAGPCPVKALPAAITVAELPPHFHALVRPPRRPRVGHGLPPLRRRRPGRRTSRWGEGSCAVGVLLTGGTGTVPRPLPRQDYASADFRAIAVEHPRDLGAARRSTELGARLRHVDLPLSSWRPSRLGALVRSGSGHSFARLEDRCGPYGLPSETDAKILAAAGSGAGIRERSSLRAKAGSAARDSRLAAGGEPRPLLERRSGKEYRGYSSWPCVQDVSLKPEGHQSALAPRRGAHGQRLRLAGPADSPVGSLTLFLRATRHRGRGRLER
jgi:hypothetical protein